MYDGPADVVDYAELLQGQVVHIGVIDTTELEDDLLSVAKHLQVLRHLGVLGMHSEQEGIGCRNHGGFHRRPGSVLDSHGP